MNIKFAVNLNQQLLLIGPNLRGNPELVLLKYVCWPTP